MDTRFYTKIIQSGIELQNKQTSDLLEFHKSKTNVPSMTLHGLVRSSKLCLLLGRFNLTVHGYLSKCENRIIGNQEVTQEK